MQNIQGVLENLPLGRGTFTNVALGSNNISFPLHWHMPAELIMILEGQYDVCVGSKTFHLSANDIIFIPPGALHEMPKSYEGKHLVIQYDFLMISGIEDFSPILSSLHEPRVIGDDIHEQAAALILSIENAYLNQTGFMGAFIYAVLLQFHILLGQSLQEETQIFQNITSTKHQEYVLKFTQLLVYINNHLEKEHTLNSLAETAGFSRYHFSRLFKQYTHMSLKEYLNTQRVLAAESLLLNQNLNITEVAHQSGFNSLSTFNRAFKNIKGCSPSDFKALHIPH